MSLCRQARAVALFVLLLACLLGSPAASAQTRRLSVVCSVQIEWCERVRSEYQKATGVRVTLIHRSSIDALAMLLAERNNPRTDVWFGGTGDPHLQAAEQRLTVGYRSPRFPELQPWAQEQAERAAYRTVGVYSGILVLVYRRDQLARLHAEAPRCWRDLLAPQFADQVMMGNPGSSGTGFLILAALTQLFGEDRAIDFLKALHGNIAQYTHGGRGGIEHVVRGEASVAIGFMHDAIAARERGARIEFALPCEGTVSEIGSMSLIAGAPNLDEARLFYDWALSPEAQALAPSVGAFQYPSNRKVLVEARVVDPATSVLITYDHRRFGTTETRRRLLARWVNEVNAPANER